VIGGKIVNESGNILSAGTVIGLNGWAESPYSGEKDDFEDFLKCSFLHVQRNVTAVSGAFMAVKRSEAVCKTFSHEPNTELRVPSHSGQCFFRMIMPMQAKPIFCAVMTYIAKHCFAATGISIQTLIMRTPFRLSPRFRTRR